MKLFSLILIHTIVVAMLMAQPYSPNDQGESFREYGVSKTDYDKITAIIAKHAKADELEAGGYSVSQDSAVSRVLEILPLIYYHDKVEFLGILKFLKSALHGTWDRGIVRNPLVAMVRADDFDTFQKALSIDAELAYVPTRYWESSAPSPIGEIVKAGKTQWLKFLIEAKYDLNRDPALTGMKNDRYWVANLLTVAPSPEIDKLLVLAGVREVIPTEWHSKSLDDNVRVRDVYGLSGKVLFKISKGTEFKVLAQSARWETIPDVGTSVWLKVDVAGKIGWLFGTFAWLDDEI